MTYNYKDIPPPPNDADIDLGNADNVTYVDYFKAHGVRVVNMSFGESAKDYESALEANGLGRMQRRASRSRSAGISKTSNRSTT